jgi:hypothetical protein
MSRKSRRRGRCAPQSARISSLTSPEQKNFAEIERLEGLLQELRANSSTARETEAIREIGLEIAMAIREIGAMLINVGWEQSYAVQKPRDDSQ